MGWPITCLSRRDSVLVDTRYLLSDEQMKEFIVNGFVKPKTTLLAEVHHRTCECTEEVSAKDGNPDNNILLRLRELNKVFVDPAILYPARTTICRLEVNLCQMR